MKIKKLILTLFAGVCAGVSCAYAHVSTTEFGTDIDRATVGSFSVGRNPYLMRSSRSFSSDVERC